MAEDMHFNPASLQPLRTWFKEMTGWLANNGCHCPDCRWIRSEPLRWKACKLAHRILTRKTEMLIRVATELRSHSVCDETSLVNADESQPQIAA